MYLIRDIHNIDLFNKRFSSEPLIATIGNFDGLHLGHKEIIKKMKSIGAKDNLKTLVIFTEPHAAEYFSKINNSSPPPRIIPWRDKLRLISENGIDFCMLLRFDESLKSMTPEQFTEKILEELQIKSLTIGDDFKFGKDRKGDYQFLKNWGESMSIENDKTDPIKVNDQRVSSTRIREQLSKGNFEQAERMLGYKYRITGQIISGKKIGRRIDTPTANIEIDNQEFCLNGVYLCKTKLNDEIFFSIVNFGPKPTFDDYNQSLEAHLLDFEGNLYNQSVCVEFLCKIRDQIKFASIDELKAQINKDKKTVFELIKSYE